MRRRQLSPRFSLAFFLFFCGAPLLLRAQQDRGTIAGTVSDSSGARIPHADLAIRNIGTNEVRHAETGAAGEYVVPTLPVGKYEVTAQAAGFGAEVRKNIDLQIQQRLELDFALQVTAQTKEIVVNAAPPPLQTQDSSLGQVISNQTIVNMPLNGRDIYQLVTLAPGVVTEPDGLPALSGQPGQQQGFVLDGIDNNNYQGAYLSAGSMVIQPSPDAVEEFKVQTGNYSAEFGQAGGGVVNVVMKSGTNQLHGTAYEFLRNEKLDARNFFEQAKSPFKQNQFGITAGGPIVVPKVFNGKNKLFFFADYEGTRIRSVNVVDTAVPTEAWRQGDFRSLLTGNTFADPCTGATYDTGQLFDPNTTRQVTCLNGSTGYTRTPISYNGQLNVVDPSKIVAPAANTIKLLPAPNVGSNAFYWTPHTATDNNKFDVKIDYQLGSADHLSWRYDFSDSPPTSTPFIPGAASSTTVFQTRQQGAGFSETHIFSPQIVNEARVGYQRNAGLSGLTGADLDPASLGYGGLIYEKGLLGGVPTLNISDAGLPLGAPGWNPTKYVGQATNFVEALNIVRGKHTFKIGGSVNLPAFSQFQSPAPLGQYNFSGVLTSDLNAPVSTGSGFAQFLFGVPDFSSLSNASLTRLGRTTGAVYVQDDWKFSPKLTLNLGLRWEGGGTDHEQYDRLTGADLATQSFVIPVTRQNIPPHLGPSFPVEYTKNTTLMLASNKNFGPRVGFAYQVTPKTVIRSAFGIYYANPYPEGTTGYNLNPPWGSIIYINSPRTGPIDPVTGQAVVPVTNITTGFNNPQAALANLADKSLLYLYDLKPLFPYTLSWNFAVQRDIGWNTVVEAAYSGTEGNHILTGYDPNQAYPTTNPNSDPATRRPYPEFGLLGWVSTGAKSSYNALQLKAEKRFTNGIQFLAAYTWSHSIDNAPLCVLAGNQGEGDCFRDSHNLDIDRSNSGFDVRQRLSASWVYDLPFGAGRTFGSNWNRAVNGVLGGWQLTGIQTWQTGTPYTPVSYSDPANSPTYSGLARAEVVGNPYDFSYGQDLQAARGCPVGHQSIQCWVNPAAFTLAPPGQYGNADRNSIYGPGLVTLDLGLYKSFNIVEQKRLEFRGEFFNSLNHPNFGRPGQAVDDPANFGVIRSAGAPREVQVALKFIY